MAYLNPYHTLATILGQAFESADVDQNKIKKKVLAEYDLAGADGVQVDNQFVNKSEALELLSSIIEGEENADWIIYSNEDLLNFFKTGDPKVFARLESIFEPIAHGIVSRLKSKISIQYGDALKQAVKTKEFMKVKDLCRHPLSFDQAFEVACYDLTHQFLSSAIADIEGLLGDNRMDKDLYFQLSYLWSTEQASILNLLPSYFDSLKDQLVQNLHKLAIKVYSEFENKFLAQRIIGNLDKLVASSALNLESKRLKGEMS